MALGCGREVGEGDRLRQAVGAADWEVFFPAYLLKSPTLGYPTVASWMTALQEVSCAFVTPGKTSRLPAKP